MVNLLHIFWHNDFRKSLEPSSSSGESTGVAIEILSRKRPLRTRTENSERNRGGLPLIKIRGCGVQISKGIGNGIVIRLGVLRAHDGIEVEFELSDQYSENALLFNQRDAWTNNARFG
jgi:hypothetical protein